MNGIMQPDPSNIDLDLRGIYCPMAFVKFRIYADQLPDNTEFKVAYDNTKANEPLIRSIKSLGHLVTLVENASNETKVINISVRVKK